MPVPTVVFSFWFLLLGDIWHLWFRCCDRKRNAEKHVLWNVYVCRTYRAATDGLNLLCWCQWSCDLDFAPAVILHDRNDNLQIWLLNFCQRNKLVALCSTSKLDRGPNAFCSWQLHCARPKTYLSEFVGKRWVSECYRCCFSEKKSRGFVSQNSIPNTKRVYKFMALPTEAGGWTDSARLVFNRMQCRLGTSHYVYFHSEDSGWYILYFVWKRL